MTEWHSAFVARCYEHDSSGANSHAVMMKNSTQCESRELPVFSRAPNCLITRALAGE